MSQDYDNDDRTRAARGLVAWGIVMFVLWVIVTLLMSCSPHTPSVNPGPNLDPAEEYLNIGIHYSDKARKELQKAKRAAIEARLDAESAKSLVAQMRKDNNKYADQVEHLRSSYETKIQELQTHINETDLILVDLQKTLGITQEELLKAQAMIAESEKEKQSLRAALAKSQREAEKYKLKYESLKKYRYAIIAITIWLVIKILGSIGAWTPQGRITKALIG